MEFKLISIILIVSILLFSGCIMEKNNTKNEVESIYGEVNILSGNINSINFTELKTRLLEHDMKFVKRNNSTIEPDLMYWALYPTNKTNHYELYLEIYEGEQNSWIDIKYTPSRSFNKSQIDTKKEWIINKTDIVVSACNLTIDWSQAEWTVNYAD